MSTKKCFRNDARAKAIGKAKYADDLKFHVDVVPCIPEGKARRTLLATNMVNTGINENLAQSVAELSVSITDDRLSNYSVISDDWLGSNPEGYAKWSLRLLADKMVEMNYVPSISYVSVGNMLKKMNLSLGK